jgi:L-asparaginase II
MRIVDGVPLVEVVRSGAVESVHRGSVVALGADGRPAVSAGSVDSPIFGRSSNKPLQAVGMLRAGLDVDGPDLALAAASHNGEPDHVAGARRLLAEAGLDTAALRCPPALPIEEEAHRAADGRPDRIYMNCSGKHAAMLLTCVRAGWSTVDYTDPAHPLQKEIRSTIEELAGEKVTAIGVDGCGAPIFALTLTGLARGFARLTTAMPGTYERRVADAMRAHPFLVAGTGREDTTMMTAVPGLLMKGGAEGVHGAALPTGAAIALKIDDGAARARVPVLLEVLHRLGVETPGVTADPVLGGGVPVGEFRTVLH